MKNIWKLIFGWTLLFIGGLFAAIITPKFIGAPAGALIAFFGGEICGDELKGKSPPKPEN